MANAKEWQFTERGMSLFGDIEYDFSTEVENKTGTSSTLTFTIYNVTNPCSFQLSKVILEAKYIGTNCSGISKNATYHSRDPSIGVKQGGGT